MLRSRRISGAKSFEKQPVSTKIHPLASLTRSNSVALSFVLGVTEIALTDAADSLYIKNNANFLFYSSDDDHTLR